MNPTVALSLAMAVLAALAILATNNLVETYIRPNEGTSPAGESVALVLLALFGVVVAAISLRTQGGLQGYTLPIITVVVVIVSFVLGTSRIG